MAKSVAAQSLVRALRKGELTPFRFVAAFQRVGFSARDAWQVVADVGL